MVLIIILCWFDRLATVASILPKEKTFSAALFLSTVHSGTAFKDFQRALPHLRALIVKQSTQREDLVRTYFGLFIHCADDLEWLKAYRLGSE